MFRTDLLSVIRSLNTVLTAIYVCQIRQCQQEIKHINIRTTKKNCIRPTQQFGITKYAEKTASNMTNTYCCEYNIETPDDGQEVCPKHVEFFTKIKLRNSASCWLLL